MKRHWFLRRYFAIAGIVSTIILVPFSIRAEEVVIENNAGVPPLKCLSEDLTCVQSPILRDNASLTNNCSDNPESFTISQKIWSYPSDIISYAPVHITGIDFFTGQYEDCPGENGNQSETCYVDFFEHDTDSVAAETYQIGVSPYFQTRNRTDYETWHTNKDYYATSTRGLEKISLRCNNQIRTSQILWRITQNIYTNNYCDPNTWGVCPDENSYDLAFNLYSDNVRLQITEPAQNSIVVNNIDSNGTCRGDVRYCIHNEYLTASSTAIYCSTATCINSAWDGTAITSLDSGVWYISASSTPTGFSTDDEDMNIFTFQRTYYGGQPDHLFPYSLL